MRLPSLIAAALLLGSGPGLASTKPCRGPDGKIIKCAKPARTSQRCKDAQGRFVKCPPAGADDKPGHG